MKDHTVLLSSLKYIDEDVFAEIKNYTISSNDLYLTIAGTIGDVGLVPAELDGANLTENAAKLTDIKCSKQYLMYVLMSSIAQDHFCSRFHQVAQPKLSLETASSTLIPLPPYREQLRIAEELDRWLGVLVSVEDDLSELTNYVRKTKSKILDLAISGKLAPQDPDDESAIELLKRINPDFQSCDNSHYENLPQGWVVCRLEDVCQICDNQRQPINSTERQERKKRAQTLYPYYGATGQVDWIDDYILDGTFILLGEDGAPFLDKFADKAYVVSGKIWVNNHAHILKPNCDITYLTYYLNRYDYSKCVNGSTRLKLTQADMKNMTIVLPPLVEQHRIAGRIENIFRMLDAITAEL